VFAAGEYPDDVFDVVFVEFGDFVEEFFFVGLGHVLFQVAELREEFVFLLLGERELAEPFEEGGDLLLHVVVPDLVACSKVVVAL
jgi:hypothetical protein